MIATDTMTCGTLARVAGAPTILAALHAFDAVADAARLEGPAGHDALAAAVDDPDPLVSLAAVHAGGAVGGEVAERLLLPLLLSENPHLREHAAWALAAGPPVRRAEIVLREVAAGADFAAVLAQATLDRWGSPDVPPPARPVRRPGALTVAQLFLHGEIDSSLSDAGKGDTGGIATLLVDLGDALLEEPGVERVLTLSRAAQERPTASGSTGTTYLAPGHHHLGIDVPRPAPPASRSWGLRPAALEGLRAQLSAAGRVDVLHLRMADVGSWAAAQVARELGIPVVLTMAPDPHAQIAAREAAGQLTRASFAAADLAEHLVFRVRLLSALRDQARALVVFPRPSLRRDLLELLDLDDATAVHIVPEGIDVEAVVEADEQVARALGGAAPSAEAAAALADLDRLLGTLPPERRDLPLVISVGRLHPVKGMATLARAWAVSALAARCNLVVVGGDLDRPTSDEEQQLALLDAVVPRAQGPSRGLLLAGHRSNRTVATWLSAARRGRPGLAAPGGVYVCASLKEEFGIALCEALASGLVVVAPDQGGPPTYVEHGRTGFLVETADRDALGAAVGRALDLAAAPGDDARAAHARQVVTEGFSIGTMAAALADVYREVAR
jgi:glycosyltransferase involved in cell wall biosynthesis